MKKSNKSLLVILLVLVLLIGGAYVLYTKLSPQLKNDGLTSTSSQTQESSEASSAPAESSQAESSTESSAESSDEEVPPAPDFTVYDKDGNEVKLTDFVGKPIIMNFWSSNCGPCRSEMPEFEKFYQKYKEDVHFFMVNMTDGSWDTVDSASDYVEKAGLSFPIYFDTDMDAAITYGVNALPTTFFIDKDGYVAAYAISALDEATLQKGLDMIYPAE